MSLIRILLVDDHALVRAGIRSLLEGLDGVTVVAEADDGYEALHILRAHHPDIVLMDIAMKELNGLEAAARMKKEFPAVRVVMLSMYASEEYVLQALRAEASGYLLKDSATPELELAIKAVMRGDTYLSPAVSKQVVGNYVQRVEGKQDSLGSLTPRQREILTMIAEGHGTKEVAYQLNVSVKTVETHRAQLMRRLDIHDIPGLVRYAIRMGLVTADA
jgi:DNA-binding NarL/FixJ family response regulator